MGSGGTPATFRWSRTPAPISPCSPPSCSRRRLPGRTPRHGPLPRCGPPYGGSPARPSEGAEHTGRSSGGRSRRRPHRGAAGEPLTLPGIPAESDVSHNHLTRLFLAATGETVVGYIRAPNGTGAPFLQTTTLSVPAVAASVGIPDLQAFNKACRHSFGASPRGIRAFPALPRPAPAVAVAPTVCRARFPV
ncbi:helix-turn-helix domain-containing protein [Streptomyces sp. DSM 41634]|uniref:helix-turn-helix domain-containing protein n=1 Tax=Streptomyces sp. DSM 41634 TaxID=3448656 RepID=UPI0028836BB7|nr:helix-turn-helix domain-containing protein [Streptomyces sp. DSM 41633]